VETGLECGMADVDAHDSIEELEQRIEALAATAEACRKVLVFAKAAMCLGALVIFAVLLTPIRFDPAITIGAMAAVIGGIVAFGSNTSTLERATADMKAAETRRHELINGMVLHPVE
jgi:hypothetical protein